MAKEQRVDAHTDDSRPLGYQSLSAFRFVDTHTKVSQTPK